MKFFLEWKRVLARLAGRVTGVARTGPHGQSPQRRTLAVLAGLLSPAKKLPNGKSRPVTSIRPPRAEWSTAGRACWSCGSSVVGAQRRRCLSGLAVDLHGRVSLARTAARRRGAGRSSRGLLWAAARCPARSAHCLVVCRHARREPQPLDCGIQNA